MVVVTFLLQDILVFDLQRPSTNVPWGITVVGGRDQVNFLEDWLNLPSTQGLKSMRLIQYGSYNV